jgi:TonB-dependent SusC/RagA subfamily outer membrane receptor
MTRARRCSSEPAMPGAFGTRLSLPFAAMLLSLVGGCSYANSTGATRTSDAMLRVEDSVRTHSSVDLGYTVQPRGQITGAVSTASFGDGAHPGHVRSLYDLLQGRIAGLEVTSTAGGSVSMRVRGAGGGFSAPDPLVVIDGDPMPAGSALHSLLAGIDAQDVIRVDVLKDISSTAIYGTRGSNGVVLITLRHRVRE